MKRVLNLLREGLLLIGLSILAIASVNGQCTVFGTNLGAEQNTSEIATMGGEDGQTFTACGTGNITSISIRMDINNTYNGNMNLWILNGSVPGFNSSTPYQQFMTSGTGVITIPLNTPFPVIAGNIYTVGFGAVGAGNNPVIDAHQIAPNGPYFDGQLILNGALFAASDLNFSVTISPGNPIPTLSQWGLLIFGLLVLNLGLVFVYKKQLITSEARLPATYIPFNKSAFSKYFIIALSIIGVGFILAMTLFGYELMTFDVPGSVLTAALIAYFIQLLKHE